MKLSQAQSDLLRALLDGQQLKPHRYPSGEKVFRLHALDRPPQAVPREIVEFLSEHDLIDINKKFPSATYWLTEQGRRSTQRLRS